MTRAAVLVAAAAVNLALSGCAGDPPGYDTPESVLHDPVADVYLVSNINGAPLDKDGNGYIARVDPDGGGMERYWIRGGHGGVTLHAPKGLAIHGETLWVADIDVLRRFDRSSGAPRGEVAIPGATFLNDCAAAPDGTIYCTDSGLDAAFGSTGTDAIWRVPPGSDEPEVLVRGEALGQPNGIVARPAGVYVVSWRDGTFYEVDTKGRRTDLGKAGTAKLDGLVRVDRTYYITSWEGRCVYRFAITGGFEALPARLEQPADCGYDAARDRLLVPLFGGDAIETVPLAVR